MFIGLTVSAEEIFRDRKILKRERLLNLSRHSYLTSKVAILFLLSAIQSFLFVLIGNAILEINGMLMSYWAVLFSIFCLSNLLGLNISSAFNSAVTIYILIPILIIPQMILGGAMFQYENLNKWIGGGYDVPAVAELMPSRWAYETLMVEQYKNNQWGKVFYNLDQQISESDYKTNYWLSELENKLDFCKRFNNSKNDSIQAIVKNNLLLLNNELNIERLINKDISFQNIVDIDLNKTATNKTFSKFQTQLAMTSAYYKGIYSENTIKKESFIAKQEENKESKIAFTTFRNQYFNESIHDIVKKSNIGKTQFVKELEIKKVMDPIYTFYPNEGYLQLKYPLFTPYKYLFKKRVDTFWFNLTVIWFYILILYLLLYYDMLQKFIALFSRD